MESKQEIKTAYLEVSKTARYATYGNLSSKTKYLWMALHGSNMVCEQMLYKFSDFDPEEHFVIAPEALSRFYHEGYQGPVVAAWMTKRDRLHEIKDLSDYLSTLFSSFSDKVSPECKKCILGFSQGGTMAFRWLHRHQVAFDHLIAYSSWIPEDINLKESKTVLNGSDLVFTYGTEDPYLKPETIEKVRAIIKENQLDIEVRPHPGKHKVDRHNLMQIFKERIQNL